MRDYSKELVQAGFKPRGTLALSQPTSPPKSDVPTFVRFHAPAIRRYLAKWNEDIEQDDFLRGRDPTGARHLFKCVKFPGSDSFVTDIEISQISNDHQFLLIYRGYSDLFTNIHADCAKADVVAQIRRDVQSFWNKRFPNRTRITEIPKPEDTPKGLGYQFRSDWCHHCDAYTTHGNQMHDPYTFHCVNKHIARTKFEN